jgi:hypothetical protein
MKKYILLILVCLIASPLLAQGTTIPTKTAEMKKYSGYFPFYWDAKTGKIWLEIDKWNTEFLYVESLPAGIGSNDIGLDRGQIGDSRIVSFQRSGPRVLLIQSNYTFRAVTEDPNERETVKQSFAQSALWGFTIEAEENDHALVDATDFFLHDAHHVIDVLKQTGQGDFKLDASRSMIYLPESKNFPLNTELEATLTFTGSAPGEWVRDVVPSPSEITVREHHSLIQLPDGNFKTRVFDPRSGFFGPVYMDFATPVSEPIWKRLIARHRLQKKDPSAAMSEPVKPIIYYVDNGAPEPIRSALIEGAQWWNQAFEAAGYKNAFQVKVLPEDADPMDVRYNTIQWVHRYTRGWSYGNAVYDPRTGEIIKGHVTLGSQRIRQDYLIAQGLISPFEQGKPVSPVMMEMALARLRQLSAHEVGHTLGLSHNYIASAENRASVMDYPHPFITVNSDQSLDFSKAYATGIGEWDKVSIAYGYQDFPSGVNEKEKLNEIINNAAARGLIFISDADARPQGSAHPKAHLWDNGTDATADLARILQVRSVALNRFSENSIPVGAPMGTLEEVLVPVYLSHRYQLEAVSKIVGGLNYTYALRGDGQIVTQMIPPADQRSALEALLKTIQPETLMFPERILQILPPRPDNYSRTREMFKIKTGLTFDALAAAETASDMTIALLLNSERAARLVEYHSRDAQQPSFQEVTERLLETTWKAPHGSGYSAAIQRQVDGVVLYRLMELAADESASEQVRAIAYFKLNQLLEWLKAQSKKTNIEEQLAHQMLAISQIERFQKDPGKIPVTKPEAPPAGAPIGMFDFCSWED